MKEKKPVERRGKKERQPGGGKTQIEMVRFRNATKRRPGIDLQLKGKKWWKSIYLTQKKLGEED